MINDIICIQKQETMMRRPEKAGARKRSEPWF